MLPPITGVILAGGRGQRMGGVDKGLQRLAGQALVAWVAARLRPQVSHLLINANRHAADYAAYAEAVVPDALPGFAGPLAGLHAALSVASTDWVVTVPCDSPHLPHDLVARLWSGRPPGAEMAYAVAGGRTHPVFCLCRTSLLPRLATDLADGMRRFQAWAEAVGAQPVSFDDVPEAFANFNTLADLAAGAPPG